MKIKNLRSNLFLVIVIGASVIFYAYFINKNKGSIKIDSKSEVTVEKKTQVESGVTIFKDTEYKTTEGDKEYITRGKEARIDKNEPDLIKLTGVNSFTKLKDGTILRVQSKKANYYKKTKNIKYFGDVIITNKDKRVTSDIANFISDKSLIKLEDNVVMVDPKNTIKGDIALLDTKTNDLEILMKKEEDKVYGKRQDSKK